MFYSLNDNIVKIYDRQSFNIFQNIDPKTQTPFIDSNEAYEWAINFMKSYNIINIDISISDSTGATITNAIPYQPFLIKLQEDQGKINGTYNMFTINVDDLTLQEIEFNFVNGVAISTVIIKNPGDFILLVNNQFTMDDGSTAITFCDESKYIIKCIESVV